MATTKKKTGKIRSESEDVRRGRSRFMDQPGQWVDISSPAVKKRRSKGLAELRKEMEKKGKKK